MKVKILDELDSLLEDKDLKSLSIRTFGSFRVFLDGEEISRKSWGRDKTVQLLQFLITNRHRSSLHKEQIIDRIWEDAGTEGDFKVALHGINKAIEPNKKSRSDSKYIERQGSSYQLIMDHIWIDSEAFSHLIKIGNQYIETDTEISKKAFNYAISLYKGAYLPERIYEDWSSASREKLQILAINAYVSLGELLLNSNPNEVIRLMEEVKTFDNCWEEAYRLEMQAFLKKGNRPQALKTFQQCAHILKEEYGVPPLPETQQLLREIQAI